MSYHEQQLEKISDADSARAELLLALQDSGIPLPSVSVDVPSVAADPVRPMIDLGCCSVPTARALTAALRVAAHRRGPAEEPDAASHDVAAVAHTPAPTTAEER